MLRKQDLEGKKYFGHTPSFTGTDHIEVLKLSFMQVFSPLKKIGEGSGVFKFFVISYSVVQIFFFFAIFPLGGVNEPNP